MRWMGMLTLLAAVAAAKNDRAAEIRKLEADGKAIEAVQVAGTWVAEAQKRGDLLDEQAAWEALRDVRIKDDQYREACACVMKLLDPKRSGAFLSAHLLAHELARMAVWENDDRYLADAVAVLAAPRKDAGACDAALADFAAGVLAARKGQDAARLTAAFDAAMKNGWLDLATYAGIEIACIDKKVGRDSGALKRLDEALNKSGDDYLRNERMRLATKRIPEAPPLDAGGGAPGAAGEGGAGGAGGAAGGPAESAVGAAWKRWAASKALLEVKRAGRGFEIKPLFPGAAKGTCGPGPGEHHWNGGGVTLSFFDAGVALCMIDPTGLNGQPGDGAPGRWRVFYALAPGEAWGVTKSGIVVVKK